MSPTAQQVRQYAKTARNATTKRDAAIQRMRDEGASLREIAQVAELSHTAIAKIVNRAPRRGRWSYITGVGWRLDDTDLVLDFDPLDRSCGDRGCYVLNGGGHLHEPIDSYLDGAMRFVESRSSRAGGAAGQLN